jgi:sugar lactone lactonase YvrE
MVCKNNKKCSLIFGFIVLFGIENSVLAQVNGEINDQSEPYSLNQDHFNFPTDRPIGSTAAMALDLDGTSIWTFDRCGDNWCVGSDMAPIQKFDASGNLVTSFGANMFNRPHGIHVDYEGNIWVTDFEGPDGVDPRRDGKGHQVFKFSPEGELLMTLGKPGIAGDGPDEFNKPSSVLVAPNGDIFVGDGHGGDSNARVLKFSSDGIFIKSWGGSGSAPGEFNEPHALAMDSAGRLFVGDRANSRVQIFDQDGNFIDQWNQFGRPSGMVIDSNDILYIADSSSVGRNPGWQEGIRIGSAKTGDVTAFIEDPDGDGSQEGVVVDVNGVIYGSLTGGMALRRYVEN